MTGFVGYDPTLNEVIVSHQGTDVSKMWEDLPRMQLETRSLFLIKLV